MIHIESAKAYYAREAVSAGFLWEMVKPDGCPRLAWFHSVFNPNPPPAKVARELDIGTAAHLAILEPDEMMSRICLIDAANYLTASAREMRAFAYEDGFTPLLAHEYQLVLNMRRAIEDSDDAELLLGEGQSEVNYTWEIGGPDQFDPLAAPLQCKARADRITTGAIIDLKTAASASPEAFQRAMVRDGHHLRAAWYIDGWNAQYPELKHGNRTITEHITWESHPDYIYPVVAKKPPHIVSIFTTGETRGDSWFQIDPHAIATGRREYHRGLRMVRAGMDSGVWPAYTRKNKIIDLPTHEEYRLAELEADGELDL